MKKKLKWFNTIILSSTYFTTLPIVAISCNNVESKQENLRNLVVNLKNEIPTNPYFLDSSTELNTNIHENDMFQTLGAGNLFRVQTIKAPEYNVDVKNTLKAPGLMKYKMELAKSITITTSSGDMTFDNDGVDLSLKTRGSGSYQYATSNDNKSINSKAFIDAMNNAKKMSIEIKDNVYWTDVHGQKTKYKVVAQDFWYSYMRSYYSGYFQREMRGHNNKAEDIKNPKKQYLGMFNSKAMDNNIRKENKDAVARRFGSVLFTNNQQFEINGLSSKKFMEFDVANKTFEPINAIKNNKLVFEADPDYASSKDFLNYFELLLAKSTIYAAAPSQYIDDLAKNKDISSKEITATNGKNKWKVPAYGYGVIYKIGLYFYGTKNWDKNLYVGAYYPNKDKSSPQKLVFMKNNNYWDQDWVKRNDNLESIEFSHRLNNDQTTSFENFKNNENVVLDLNNLTDDQRNYINSHVEEFNLVSYKDYRNSLSIGNTAFQITPRPDSIPAGAKEIQHIDYSKFYNDKFAKIVYGATFEELNKGFIGENKNYNTNRKSIGSGVFDNTSIAFRTMLNGSINWNYIKDQMGQSNELWLSNAAPDALLGGNDQNSSKYKTPRDAANIINDLKIINHDGSLVKIVANKNYKNTYKSVGFDSIKIALSNLLDKVYSENSWDKNVDKITWKIYNNRILDEKQRGYYTEIVKVLKKLDSRLDPQFNELKTQDEIDILFGKSNGSGQGYIAQHISYSYEFNTLSPYLDKICHALGISPFALWHKFSTLNPSKPGDKNLLDNFPELVRFSTELKNKFTSPDYNYNEVYKVKSGKNFGEANSSEFVPISWDDLAKFNSYEEESLYLKGIPKIDATKNNGKPYWTYGGFGGVGYKWDPAKLVFSTDNITEQSRFARYYVQNHTNEQLVELLRELNTWRSFNIDLDKSIQNIDTLNYKVAHKGLDFIIPAFNVIYAQDYKVTK